MTVHALAQMPTIISYRYSEPPLLARRRRSFVRQNHLRRKYQRQLQQLHAQGAQPRQLQEPSSAQQAASSFFSSCWPGTKYLGFKAIDKAGG